MQQRKLSVRQALFLGQTIVNGGVFIIMISVWVLSFVLVLKAGLSLWIALVGIFAGPLVAWIWWSFSIPRWRYWIRQYLNDDEIEELHQRAVSSQLEWPRGNAFEKTEFKSSEHKQQDLLVAINSTESFINKIAPRFINESKVTFPNFDTSVFDEIRGLLFNLKAMISISGDISDVSASMERINKLIEKLNRETNTLKERQWGEILEWAYEASELTDKLHQLRVALQSLDSK